jgi:ferredoxin
MDHTPSVSTTATTWRVTFNDQCSLCEICVNRCPRQAFTIRKRDLTEEILFDDGRCDGCGGSPLCRDDCPEKAVTVVALPPGTMAVGQVVLVTGELARCASCGTTFMPERKLAALLKKQVITANPVHAYCPECRRGRLLDRYMEMLDGGQNRGQKTEG